jgi:hypothetical protein
MHDEICATFWMHRILMNLGHAQEGEKKRKSASPISEMHEFGMNTTPEGSVTGSDVRSLASDYVPVPSLAEVTKPGTLVATGPRPNACTPKFIPAGSFLEAASTGPVGPGSSKGSIQSRSLTFCAKDGERASGEPSTVPPLLDVLWFRFWSSLVLCAQVCTLEKLF